MNLLDGYRMVHKMAGILEELGSEGARIRTAPEILVGGVRHGAATMGMRPLQPDFVSFFAALCSSSHLLEDKVQLA